jgi:hydroxymethylpyrimidine/phosphomethylpyrimidine kinase
MHTAAQRIALTIAGSDSGGGAGIQADLKTFHRYGVFGTSVITAVTAQNTRGVMDWMAVSPTLVAAQIDAVATDLRPAALKSGMLANEEIVLAVADSLRAHELGPYVLDPVMVASSGDPLLLPGAMDAIRAKLLPVATLVTPNLDEAEILLGRPVRDAAAMEAAARALVDAGASAALVKGGHLDGSDVVDVLFDGEQMLRLRRTRIDSRHTHGTGCTLSAAITAQLALGRSLRDAVTTALDWVHEAIATAPGLGAGHGPLNHHA